MHLIKNNQSKRKNISKKKIFFIIFFFTLILFIFFLIKKPKNNIKNLNQTEYYEIVQEINAKKNLDYKNVENFIIDNKNIYGTLVSLLLSKQYILKNELEKAFVQLDNSLKYTEEENLKNILRLRMSKIKIEQKKYKDAIEIIEKIKDNSWVNIVEDVKGDIFMKNKNIKLAIKAWEESNYFEKSKTSKEITNMKINEAKQIN
ncbi:YfgM family protein [Buchnera aphidicola]|uniref:Ancillary SecYEG translocon subunit n=1 Tax=Buchnera aphidicola (Aphis nerii) TaxID=1241835 RepID=A0A4D6XZQ3_9GAMM|nr:tetratricopeptide repeat protein [Buchnera aphidicola]QCI19111.1 tetratricopeptide repeat protein [Buchnera aphidicola (Aphis nerii)]